MDVRLLQPSRQADAVNMTGAIHGYSLALELVGQVFQRVLILVPLEPLPVV